MKILRALFCLFLITHPDYLMADTVIADQAKTAGFKTCHEAVNNVGNYVVASREHDSRAVWNEKNTDERLFHNLTVIDDAGTKTTAVTSVVQNKSGNCDASYTIVNYLELSCDTVKGMLLATGWVSSGNLQNLNVFLNQEQSVSNLLMPAGEKCISIATQAVYF